MGWMNGVPSLRYHIPQRQRELHCALICITSCMVDLFRPLASKVIMACCCIARFNSCIQSELDKLKKNVDTSTPACWELCINLCKYTSTVMVLRRYACNVLVRNFPCDFATPT
jgi:hypothetical protein